MRQGTIGNNDYTLLRLTSLMITLFNLSKFIRHILSDAGYLLLLTTVR